MVRCSIAVCRIETEQGALLKLWTERQGRIEICLRSNQGVPWDEHRIDQLVPELAGIGVHFEPDGKMLRAPLEPLADEGRRQRFLTSIEPVLDTLTGSPQDHG